MTSPADRTYYSPRIFLLIFNPGGLIKQRGWNNPRSITSEVILRLQKSTNYSVRYRVVKTLEVDAFPAKTDGFVYTSDSYKTPGHQPDMADYSHIIHDYDVDCAINYDAIDELWMWGGPYFGFWESNLAGPGSFFLNSGPITYPKLKKMLPIMGFNYERGVAEALHNFGHRLESTMTRVYGGWRADQSTYWNQFSLLNKDAEGRGGVGNCHFPVNARRDYDYSSVEKVTSSAPDWENFPDFKGEKAEINASEWGNDQIRYLSWLFNHVPHLKGTAPDGKLANWWKYVVDPNRTINV